MNENAPRPETAASTLQRGITILKVLSESSGHGLRLKDIADAAGLSPATAHRIIAVLVSEGLVDKDPASRKYRLAMALFEIATRAGNPNNLRTISRPALLRLSTTFGDTLFLLVRNGFDAMCLDRSEGPFPIRTFTGEIGGRVALGVGQGSLAILAHLDDSDREDVIRYNMPRLLQYGVDEVMLRGEIERAQALGYAGRSPGQLPGMAAVAVPIRNRQGHAIAALSVATISERLDERRMQIIVNLLNKEAQAIAEQITPFDPALRNPSTLL